jgi:DNA repair exonuclease SbcCD ATPase subunit
MGTDKTSETPLSPDERTKLEIEKLQAEVRELQMAFWKKPAYLGVFLPVGLAVITLFAAIVTGYFSAERKRLEAEKAQLQSELNAMNSKKDTLEVQTTQLRKDGQAIVTQLRTSLDAMKKAADDKDGQLADLIKKLDTGKANPQEVRAEAQSIRNKLGSIQADIAASETKLKMHTAFEGGP